MRFNTIYVGISLNIIWIENALVSPVFEHTTLVMRIAHLMWLGLHGSASFNLPFVCTLIGNSVIKSNSKYAMYYKN